MKRQFKLPGVSTLLGLFILALSGLLLVMTSGSPFSVNQGGLCGLLGLAAIAIIFSLTSGGK